MAVRSAIVQTIMNAMMAHDRDSWSDFAFGTAVGFLYDLREDCAKRVPGDPVEDHLYCDATAAIGVLVHLTGTLESLHSGVAGTTINVKQLRSEVEEQMRKQDFLERITITGAALVRDLRKWAARA